MWNSKGQVLYMRSSRSNGYIHDVRGVRSYMCFTQQRDLLVRELRVIREIRPLCTRRSLWKI